MHTCPVCGQGWIPPSGIIVENGRVIWRGKHILLPPKESVLFFILYNSRGKLFRIDELHSIIYGLAPDGGPYEDVIKVYISKLRKRLLIHKIPLQITYAREGRYAMVDEGKTRYDRRASQCP